MPSDASRTRAPARWPWATIALMWDCIVPPAHNLIEQPSTLRCCYSAGAATGIGASAPYRHRNGHMDVFAVADTSWSP